MNKYQRIKRRNRILAVLLCLAMVVQPFTTVVYAAPEKIVVEDSGMEAGEIDLTDGDTVSDPGVLPEGGVSGNSVSENDAPSGVLSGNEVSENAVSENEVNGEYLEGVLTEDVVIDSLEDRIGEAGQVSARQAGTFYEDLTGVQLPAQYDSRNVDGANYVTEARNQLTSNLCWAFSQASLAETNMIKKGLFSRDNLQISPDHLGYFFYHHVVDELGGTAGASVVPADSSRNYYTLGGNTLCGTFKLANWVGAVEEAKAPFSSGPQTHDNAIAYDDIGHLQNAYWVRASDRSYVKALIQEYGSAGVNCVMNSSGLRVCDDGTTSYLYAGNNAVGHAVTIIGWDDDYPAENFRSFGSSDSSKNNQPASQDGAWLIKDSYAGEDGRVDGCFYMSYEDSALNYNTVNALSYDMERAGNYDHNYQYDAACGLRDMSASNTVCGANVYQAKGNQTPNGAEKLEAVSFATLSTDAQYSIQVYTGLKSPDSDPLSGTAALAQEQTGSFAYAGYHTVELNTPVVLEEGEYFSVVVSLSKPGSSASLMVDESYSNGWAVYTAALQRGRSFYSLDGSAWTDAYDRTSGGVSHPSVVRIKAFTNDYTVQGPFYVDGDMVADIRDQTYTGNQLTPEVTIYYAGRKLTEGTDYQVTYGKNTDAGEKSGDVTIKGIGNYITATPIVKYFTIAKKDINDADIVIEGLDDCLYSGAALKPVSVKHNDKALDSSSVKITYSNNKNAGTAAVVVKGCGNYTGSRMETFRILMHDIASDTVSADQIKDQPYTGNAIHVLPVVRDVLTGTQLKNKKDYSLTYRNNIMPGQAEVIIRGKGSYTGKLTVPFTVLPRDISKLPMTAVKAQPYNGGLEVRPAIIIRDDKLTLKENVHFTAVYTNNINAGTASVSIVGREGTIYAGSSKTVSFTILPVNIASGTKLSNVGDKTFVNGQREYTQAPVLTLPDGRTLTKERDYTVKYTDNTAKGTATMTIAAVAPNYTGSIVKTFRISDKISLTDYADENLVITGFSYDRRYLFSKRNLDKNNVNKFSVKPELVLMYKGVQLENGKDYTIAYRNCNKVGTATAVITAVSGGRFYGTRTEEYYIIGRPIFPLGLDTGFALSSPVDKVYTGEDIEQDIVLTEQISTGNNSGKHVKILGDKTYKTEYHNNVNAGKASYTITGIGNYSGSAEFEFNILPRDLSTCTATKIKAQQYTGEEICPSVYLKYGKHYLVEGRDYDVTYLDNQQQGTARVIFTACSDSQNFVGSKTVTFAVKKTNLSVLKYGTDIEEIPDRIYDGTQQMPVPVLSYEGRTIPSDQYSVSYAENRKIGYGYVTVTALPESSFKGSKKIRFRIKGKPLDVAEEYGGGSFMYTGKNIRPVQDEIMTLDGEVLVKGIDYKILYKKFRNAGEGYFCLQGLGDYKGSGKVIHFTIVPQSVDECVVKGLDKAFVLGTKTEVRPAFSVYVKGRKLKKGKDYTVTCSNNNSVGNGSIRLNFVGNYDGTYSREFTIR